MRLTPGDVLRGRYEIEGLLGQGAMACVYRALDRTTGTMRAIKELDLSTLPPSEVPEARTLFEREATFLHHLTHPGFPSVTEYFDEGDACYQVQDLVEGDTLEAVVEARGALAEADVVPLAIELCSHLSFLHERPGGAIVYRDLKPSNVMLTRDGHVRLIDFGIARVYKPDRDKDTQPLGTPGYAAPEQYGAGQTTPASDVYALGATLYYALTARDPDPAPTARPPLRSVAPACSDEMEWLLATCLDAAPHRRPSSAGWVEEMLKDFRNRPPGADWAVVGAYLRESLIGWSRTRPLLRFSFVEAGLLAIAALVILAVIAPIFVRPHHTGGQVTACKSNLKNIGTALEMYSTDFGGRFPIHLSLLSPDYLKNIPTCPSIGWDTYSGGFSSTSGPDAYTVVCSGSNHGAVGLSANFPQYNSVQGLIER